MLRKPYETNTKKPKCACVACSEMASSVQEIYIYPAPTPAPLSCSSRELLVNLSVTTRELVVSCVKCVN